MQLAYVTLQGRGRTDALIAAVAQQLQTDGLRLSGVTDPGVPFVQWALAHGAVLVESAPIPEEVPAAEEIVPEAPPS